MPDRSTVIVTPSQTTIRVSQRPAKVVEVGLQGPPGRDGQASAYTHTQTDPSQVWTIPHSLDRYPSITCRTEQGEVFEGNITHNSTSIAVVTFTTPLSGFAYCV